jgi:hypothetical protein
LNSDSLKKMAQILAPGTLRQKHEQISLFTGGGHSALFDGDVSWKLSMTASDQVLRGDAESMDDALLHIKGVLEQIMKNQGPAAKVALSIEEKTA